MKNVITITKKTMALIILAIFCTAGITASLFFFKENEVIIMASFIFNGVAISYISLRQVHSKEG